ncbi:hypothetical protein SAMN04488540_1093 [Ferrimonas sediminum]|uniref:Endonuclease/exonuclease/phosphatase domain-containing protein n=1 Tax=Ferrimonas sediminum TaxID=718193 RepID=A0A1G8U8B5_9GAMM|nr:ExeM/NucH family extracellular endonuclease [Ferrimonas sediminum]SDJ49854.1 hypothetical protein SAMN04488540_1093 [Ferrimonas sediminum]
MNKSILSLAVASVISVGAHAAVEDLLITEMVQKDGGTEFGSVEITNTHATDAYTFTDDVAAFLRGNGKYDNKLLNADGNQILTGLSIEAGKSLVVLSNGVSDEYKKTITDNGGTFVVATGDPDTSYSNLYMTGNDGFYLKNGNTVIDRVGGENDGSVWAPDTTLVRRLAEDGNAPTQSANFDASQWVATSPLTTATMGTPNYAEAYVPFVCENLTDISVIQGSGSTSPLEGQTVAVKGVVTAVVSVPAKGFYIRDLISDNDPMTSDGIFVKSGSADSQLLGRTVCLGSEVAEFEGQTQLAADKWEVTDSNFTATNVTPIEVMEADKGSFDNTLERYEGMLVSLTEDLDPLTDGNQDMRVSRTFSYNYLPSSTGKNRNNMVVAYTRPNVQPNHLHVAGSPESKAAADQNDDYRLVIESATVSRNNELPYYADFNTNPHKDYIRIDDSVVGMEGVISQYETALDNATGKNELDFSLTVTNQLNGNNFIHNLPRSTSPALAEAVEKDHFPVRVASQNLFNFFNSPFGGDNNQFGQSRGAQTYDEFIHQRTKLVEAIRALDADVLALMEMENNGFGENSAIAEMVNQVNIEYVDERARDYNGPTSTENRYVFVGFDHNGNQVLDELDAIGADAIATGIMYRPSMMSIERTRVIPMPQQKAPTIVNDNGEVIKDQNKEILENGQNYHRNALVVTFVINQTGKRLTLAVNHLKSKGSTCWEDWQGVEFGDATEWNNREAPDLDRQGSCSEFRVAGAVHLGEEMEEIPGDKIILGDLNAYGKEDPLLVLTENPRNKTLVTASHTFLGYKPQFNESGAPVTITKTYGYVDIVGKFFEEKGKTPWSFSYNDEVGSLDHILISPSLEDRVVDATDWHINAAEASLYDYKNEYKGTITGGEHKFYNADIYRSSDHDPALITLSYKPGEADPGHALVLPKLRKLIKVPYQVPADAGALEGDVATIKLSPTDDEANLDLSQMVEPNVVLTEDGQTMVTFEVFGAPSAYYHATVSLKRNGEVVAGSSKSFEIEVSSRDSLVADIVEEKSDGSGGSTGFISMLSLFGLAALRRRIRK